MKKTPKWLLLVNIFLLSILLSSCMEKNTEEPNETYKFWAGQAPTKEIEIIHGKYWQSSHWSKEYIMYMEMKAPLFWRQEFIKQNQLVLSNIKENLPSDSPSWFKPNDDLKIWKPSGFTQGSVYFEDTVTGKMFIYEIQL